MPSTTLETKENSFSKRQIYWIYIESSTGLQQRNQDQGNKLLADEKDALCCVAQNRPLLGTLNVSQKQLLMEKSRERSSGGIQDSAREKGHDGKERGTEGGGREGREENKNPRKDTGGLPDDANVFLSYTKNQNDLACLLRKNIPVKVQGLMQVIIVIQMFCDWAGSWVFSRRSQISMYPSSRPI